MGAGTEEGRRTFCGKAAKELLVFLKMSISIKYIGVKSVICSLKRYNTDQSFPLLLPLLLFLSFLRQ